MKNVLTAETKDAVKLALGLSGTMTALVLGLLVTSAKGSYDAQRAALILSALAITGAVFLLLELDQPFDGIIRIPSQQMVSALSEL